MKTSHAAGFIAIVILALSFTSCGSNPNTAVYGPDELDTAIREASDYLNGRIQPISKVAFVNIQSNFPGLSEYILDNLSENAVNDSIFSVVDRKELDAIRDELKFQASGEVSDKTAQSIGQMVGAQVIVSGTVTAIGDLYRLQVKAIAVETAAVQGQWSRNIPEGKLTASLAKNQSGGKTTASASGRTGSSARAAAKTASNSSADDTADSGEVASGARANEAAVLPTVGTMVPGAGLADKLAWLQRNAESHNTYVMEINADESIAPSMIEYKGAINITIVLRGDDQNRTIRLKSNGTMFTIGSNLTFILENNITLHGHNGNNGRIINVSGGTLKMRTGSTITGNTGGGVWIHTNGTFELTGGTISGNTASNGGGVYVGDSGFSDSAKGTFTMSGGTITDNTAREGGGGVFTRSSFTMTGGKIFGNTAVEGGGVYLWDETFIIRGTAIITAIPPQVLVVEFG